MTLCNNERFLARLGHFGNAFLPCHRFGGGCRTPGRTRSSTTHRHNVPIRMSTVCPAWMGWRGGGWSSVFLSLLDYGLQLQHDTFCISILEHKVHKIRSMCVCFLMEEWKCRKRLQDDIDMPWWPTTECTCGVLGTVILFVESIQVLEWQVILALRIHHCMTFTPCHV